MRDSRYWKVVGGVTVVLWVWFCYQALSSSLALGTEIGWTHVVLAVAMTGFLSFLLGCAVAGLLDAAFGRKRR